jgi:rubrerythrin
MEGGMHAWKGLVAKGVPEAGMTYFSAAHRPEELIGLAWLLEDGANKFYSQIASFLKDQEAENLFEKLSADEEAHKGFLFKIYQEVSGLNSDPGFPGSVVSMEPGEDYMEGGLRVSEAVEWARGEKLGGILELSISLEANSHDLYLKMERKIEGKEGKKVFETLAMAEKEHLDRLSLLFERNLEGAEKLS